MVAYGLGDPLADLIETRKLLAISLVSTSLGDTVRGQVPTLATLKTLCEYRGFTTVALFWTALIRATRELGGEIAHGSSFGFLDRGRMLLTAVTGRVSCHSTRRCCRRTSNRRRRKFVHVRCRK